MPFAVIPPAQVFPTIDISHIDLTLNTFLTPAFLFVLGALIKKWFKDNEEKQSLKDKLAIERSAVITKQLNDFCEKNNKDHDTLWNKHDHHKHDSNGNVVDMTIGR
jgi:hypothetical protein